MIPFHLSGHSILSYFICQVTQIYPIHFPGNSILFNSICRVMPFYLILFVRWFLCIQFHMSGDAILSYSFCQVIPFYPIPFYDALKIKPEELTQRTWLTFPSLILLQSIYLLFFFTTMKCHVMKNLHFVVTKWDKCKMIERNSMIKSQKS